MIDADIKRLLSVLTDASVVIEKWMPRKALLEMSRAELDALQAIGPAAAALAESIEAAPMVTPSAIGDFEIIHGWGAPSRSEPE